MNFYVKIRISTKQIWQVCKPENPTNKTQSSTHHTKQRTCKQQTKSMPQTKSTPMRYHPTTKISHTSTKSTHQNGNPKIQRQTTAPDHISSAALRKTGEEQKCFISRKRTQSKWYGRLAGPSDVQTRHCYWYALQKLAVRG